MVEDTEVVSTAEKENTQVIVMSCMLVRYHGDSLESAFTIACKVFSGCPRLRIELFM